jgi:hypothetical protein
MSSNRRRTPRYQFIAEAEVTELASGMKFKARTGDLSKGGCFLDMLNPTPEGSEILVTIFRESLTCTIHARVVFVFPNMGMGVEFTSVEANQTAILEEWLAELSRGSSESNAIESSPGQNQKS